jgi:hypothetical protein
MRGRACVGDGGGARGPLCEGATIHAFELVVCPGPLTSTRVTGQTRNFTREHQDYREELCKVGQAAARPLRFAGNGYVEEIGKMESCHTQQRYRMKDSGRPS